ncbi:unnamed protein product [Ectocarpus sp. CCAP 1310/34]|nr:unnamed protein product [Ectocarpus sp. CCAP 1310/34]
MDRAALAVHLFLQRSRGQHEEGEKTTSGRMLTLLKLAGKSPPGEMGETRKNTRRWQPRDDTGWRGGNSHRRRGPRVKHPRGSYILLRKLAERWGRPRGQGGWRGGNSHRRRGPRVKHPRGSYILLRKLAERWGRPRGQGGWRGGNT